MLRNVYLPPVFPPDKVRQRLRFGSATAFDCPSRSRLLAHTSPASRLRCFSPARMCVSLRHRFLFVVLAQANEARTHYENYYEDMFDELSQFGTILDIGASIPMWLPKTLPRCGVVDEKL